MPKGKGYDSEKQRNWAHTVEGVAKLGKANVKKRDNESRGKKLRPKARKRRK